MGKVSSWLQSAPITRYTTIQERAVDTWNIILDKPTRIQCMRSGELQPHQTVRLEYLEQGFVQRGSEINQTSRESIFIMGIKNHPEKDNPDPNKKIPDTDIVRGDRLFLSDLDMTIDVITIDFTNDWLFSATAILSEGT